jgi:hypothetical protein
MLAQLAPLASAVVKKKSHHKKKDPAPDAPAARRGRPKKGAGGPLGIDPLPESTRPLDALHFRSVPVVGPNQIQRHGAIRRCVGADGLPALAFTVAHVASGMQQRVPTHMLVSALIPLTNPQYLSMTADEWSAHACASPIVHATLARLGGMTDLASLSVYDDYTDNKDAPCWVCYGDAEPAARVPPEPDVMVREVAACLLALAEHTHAHRLQQAADLEMMVGCLASRENEPWEHEPLVLAQAEVC